MHLKEMQETRGRLVQTADKLVRQALAEKRDLTPSESEKIGGMKNELFTLDQRIASEMADIRSESFQGSNRADMPLAGYSLLRALNGAASGRLDGIELEASQEISRRQGVNPSGFFVPNHILAERRSGMSVTGDAGIYGGLSVQTTVSNTFLDALRPLSQILSAGATTFSGLTSNLSFPKAAAATTASWVTEVAALTEQTPEIEQVLLSPKRVGSFTELSNQLLIQSNPGVEEFVRRDLLGAIATAIDAAAIKGTGSPSPTGILSTVGIGDVAGGTNGAAPTWAHIVALIGKVADADADMGSLRFLTNSKVLAKLRSTSKVASTDSVMILEGDTLLAYQILGSNNVPSTLTKGSASGICSALIFGNFEDVLVGQFGAGTDIIVDRFSKATTGITRVIANSYVDIAIRRPESFAAFKDILTT